GRVVTMAAAQATLADGAIYVENGVIKAVQNADDNPPAGFEDVLRVRTGDTIYPGLIDLHNHLCYNVMPLWDVPRKYTNNSQWKNHPDYARCITKPSQVLGGTEGVVEALIRFVECRNMLGGITTSQGITLSSEPGIRSLFKGLVRNVESPAKDAGLPAAGTRISNLSGSEAEKFLRSLEKREGKSCYLHHLSEGTDTTARRWFRNLQLDSGKWAINDALCGIHSTALTAEDFEILGERGGSMVFSPLSNLLLYGGTVDLAAATRAGVLMGIGCDWAPSGSKNLLGEMKVAWLVSEEHGYGLTAKEIVAMATVNAARILKWQDKLGSIESNKFADFMVLNGQSGDDFMRVLNARETSITLVVIDGVPRVGQPSLMKRFKFADDDLEKLDVGDSERRLYLAQEETHSLVKDLSLGQAIERLEEAMANLPNLAQDLVDGTAGGFVGGSVGGVGGGAGEDPVRVFLDFEETPEDVAMAAKPLTDFVTEPMKLDGITVADDSDFLKLLVAAGNLPEYVKKGLPPLYGEKIPLPPSAEFLLDAAEDLPEQILETLGDLRTFLRTWGELSWEQCKDIVDQAIIVLEQNYVHLPFKRSMHAIDPVQRLKLLRHRMEHISGADAPPELEFHNELARIFSSLRDLHTMYQLPRPFKDKMAFLPYDIEEYFENGRRRYVATNLISNPGPDSFKEGVEVTHWNGTPIDRIVDQNAERQAGSNWAA
ncbi:MAG: amidohydrolase family protein, partial [candidate division Zixibacteria bacterium]|nr:amidohydrolase family protein [candidate division Zixibacteria bacterium]